MLSAPITELSEAPALPHADAASTRALNRLYARSTPLAFALSAGSATLDWALAARVPGDTDLYGFKLGPHRGHLGLDPLAQSALLGEARPGLLPRELRAMLLADALQPGVHALEQALGLRFEWTLPGPDEPDPPFDPYRAASLSIGLARSGDAPLRCGGFVQFEHSDGLGLIASALPAEAAAQRRPLDWLRVPLSFAVGSTSVRLKEISGIRSGDIVSIEDWRPTGAAIGVGLVLGGGHSTSLVGLADGSQITIQPWKDFIVNRGSNHAPADPAGGKDAAALPLDRLDGLEVKLRFEVGELAVSLRELRSLRPGHVFELPQPLNRSTVRICAHGNVLGTGYLVAVGDKLGVRVSEFALGEHE